MPPGVMVNDPIVVKSCRVNGGLRPSAISPSIVHVTADWVMVRVYPSGAAWAPASTPTIPEAPALVTTTRGCPKYFSAAIAKVRACKSDSPPGEKGQIIEIGLFGYS